jgi:hypothetical protein
LFSSLASNRLLSYLKNEKWQAHCRCQRPPENRAGIETRGASSI